MPASSVASKKLAGGRCISTSTTPAASSAAVTSPKVHESASVTALPPFPPAPDGPLVRAPLRHLGPDLVGVLHR